MTWRSSRRGGSIRRTITVPTLVWAGEADTLVPVAHAYWLHAAITGSTLVTVPGGGHLGAFTAAGSGARLAGQRHDRV